MLQGLGKYYSRIEVEETIYANGQVNQLTPAFRQTDHAETVHLVYDEEQVSLRKSCSIISSHDPLIKQ